jgi:hypothetical protein
MNAKAGLSQPRQVILPAPAVEPALRNGQGALLRGLVAVGAGFLSRTTAPLRFGAEHPGRGHFLYCVKGDGWCEINGRLHTVRAGDFVALPPGVKFLGRAHPAAAWTVDPAQFASKGRNTPLAGRVLQGLPYATILGGRLVMREGIIL